MLIDVNDNRLPINNDALIETKRVRFRTFSTGAIESNAENIEEIILEILKSTVSERQGRAIDKDSNASMEQKTGRLFLMSSSNLVKKIIKQNSLSTLSFITCGSVDDGKSTLLGRLLYEAQLIFDDQVDSLVTDSKKIGTQGEEIDFALLVDGLAAEREQGITIDVAYRFFSTDERKFIVADSPGHEQYTRNMIMLHQMQS